MRATQIIGTLVVVFVTTLPANAHEHHNDTSRATVQLALNTALYAADAYVTPAHYRSYRSRRYGYRPYRYRSYRNYRRSYHSHGSGYYRYWHRHSYRSPYHSHRRY